MSPASSTTETIPVDPDCSPRVVHADKVHSVTSKLPPDGDTHDLAAVFSLLGEQGRLRILIALLEGEMCVCDLAAVTGLSESAVSHALRLLRGPKIVGVRRSGKMAFYSLADAHVRMLLDLGLTHVGHTSPERLTAVSG